jgi:stage V sporulation protein D (sporulation-specific penicillin-binding protein)
VDNPQVVCYVIVDEPNAADSSSQASSAFAQEIFKNIMKEAMPYLNIYATEEIPSDMQAEVDAENAAKAEQAAQEAEEEDEDDTVQTPEGTLVDPNTGEVVTMPTEDDDDDEGGILNGIESPILGEGVIQVQEESSQ